MDGTGKSTAVRELVHELDARLRPAQRLANPAGRRWLARRTQALDREIPARAQDFIETAVRLANVAVNSLQALLFGGLTVMDRHLHCQLVLRRVRGLPQGIVLPWLAQISTRDALVVVLDTDVNTAFTRIVSRNEDHESLSYLEATRAEYLRLASTNHWPVLNSGQPPQQVVAELQALLGQ